MERLALKLSLPALKLSLPALKLSLPALETALGKRKKERSESWILEGVVVYILILWGYISKLLQGLLTQDLRVSSVLLSHHSRHCTEDTDTQSRFFTLG